MDHYSANQKWGKHLIQLKWQIDDFKAEGIAEMGGNCKGGSILSSVIDFFEDGDFEPNMEYLDNKKHLKVDGDGYLTEIALFDGDGAETSIDADLFYDHLVSVEIIAFEPEVR